MSSPTLKSVRAAYAARVPAVLWGPPGTGKTAAVEALAAEVGARLIAPHIRLPEDLAAAVNTGTGVQLVPVGEFVEATQADNAIVFLDELNTLDDATLAAALRFLDSGIVGGRRIPPTVWRVAACNPPSEATAAGILRPAVANRLVHFDWVLDPLQWAQDFTAYWGAPPKLTVAEETWAEARRSVAAFIAGNPQLLLRLPEDDMERSKAWPSPRSWDHGSRLIAASGEPLESAARLMPSAVGQSAGAAFIQWAKGWHVPRADEVMDDPSIIKRLARDQLFAVLAAVAEIATNPNATHEQWLAGWAVAAAAAEHGGRALAAGLLVKPLAKVSPNHPGVQIPDIHVEPFADLLKRAAKMK